MLTQEIRDTGNRPFRTSPPHPPIDEAMGYKRPCAGQKHSCGQWYPFSLPLYQGYEVQAFFRVKTPPGTLISESNIYIFSELKIKNLKSHKSNLKSYPHFPFSLGDTGFTAGF